MAGYLELGLVTLFLKPKIRVPSGLREEENRLFSAMQLYYRHQNLPSKEVANFDISKDIVIRAYLVYTSILTGSVTNLIC